MTALRKRPFRAVQPRAEPTRARYPDDEGFAVRDGVRVFWERYGDGEPTVLLLPPWSIVPGRIWKGQIPYLARHFRVVTFDGRGAGRSDRPRGAAAYSYREFAADALAVMDATATERAVVVGLSRGGQWALPLAAEHPDRVLGTVFLAAALALTPWPPLDAVRRTFEEPGAARRALTVARILPGAIRTLTHSASMRLFARRIGVLDASAMYNAHRWRHDYHAFLEWFFGRLCSVEPHSTRQVESGVEWGLQTDPETLADAFRGQWPQPGEARRLCGAVRGPVLVIHGTHDLTCPFDWGQELSRLTGGRLLALDGADHLIGVRRPVAVNLALREFVERVSRPAPATRTALAR